MSTGERGAHYTVRVGQFELDVDAHFEVDVEALQRENAQLREQISALTLVSLIELYRNQHLAVFQYEADKCDDSVVSKLGPFHGTLTADAEHRFNGVFESDKMKKSGCNAHGRRKFRDAEDTQPRLAIEGDESDLSTTPTCQSTTRPQNENFRTSLSYD